MSSDMETHDTGAAAPMPRPKVPPQHPHERPPVNPDPKVHPVHREMPPEPIQEGTDPRQPLRETPRSRR